MTTTTMTKAEFLASKPAWAKAAIFASYEENVSDYMTDYFATRTSERVFLGWSKHTKDLFAEMRKAAALFPATAHLAVKNPETEHREKYSMGAGYYLKATGRYSNGWKVSKSAWFGSLGETVALAA